ncbi:hypothetical protein M885DRAFT_317892 [Pelagophyceae sp. CCMP2097]|nr:hypothetical protein M885DRAFT_317892 [Pelagophyceae sp. CCMP2097]
MGRGLPRPGRRPLRLAVCLSANANLGLTDCCTSQIKVANRARPLCSLFASSRPYNPLHYALYSSRPFGGGSRYVNAQWARVAHFARLNHTGSWAGAGVRKDLICGEQCVKAFHKRNPYPHDAISTPFILGFDWVITEAPSKSGEPWTKLKAPAILFVQRPVPNLVMVSNTAEAMQLLLDFAVEPAEQSLSLDRPDSKLVVYVACHGPTGQDGDVNLTPKLRRILDSPAVLRVFAQNANFQHAKLRGAPTGMLQVQLALRGDALTALAKTAPAWADRDAVVHACFHDMYQDRKDAKKFVTQQCNKNLCKWCDGSVKAAAPADQKKDFSAFGNPHLSILKYWREVVHYQFALSPFGNGKECGRTYELLALGVVPILHDYPGCRTAYEGLPVVIVKRWQEITPQNIAKWTQALLPQLNDTAAIWHRLSPSAMHAKMRAALNLSR